MFLVFYIVNFKVLSINENVELKFVNVRYWKIMDFLCNDIVN